MSCGGFDRRLSPSYDQDDPVGAALCRRLSAVRAKAQAAMARLRRVLIRFHWFASLPALLLQPRTVIAPIALFVGAMITPRLILQSPSVFRVDDRIECPHHRLQAVGPRRGFSIGPVIGSQVRNRLFAGGKDRGGVRLPWSVEHVNPVGSREFPALAERPLP